MICLCIIFWPFRWLTFCEGAPKTIPGVGTVSYLGSFLFFRKNSDEVQAAACFLHISISDVALVVASLDD